MKKILLLFSSILLVLFFASAKSNVYAKEETNQFSTFSSENELRAYANALGFNISSSYQFSELAECSPTYENSKTIKDKLQYKVFIYDFVLQNRDNLSLYAYIFKVHLSPQNGRNWGFLGIGSYGGQYVNGYVKVTATRSSSSSFLDYAPKNQPSSNTGTIGVSVGTSGFDISASYNYDLSDLSITSNTNFGKNIYETVYNFANDGSSYESYSDYQKGDVDVYGMLLLQFDYAMTMIPQYDICFYEVSGYESDVLIERGNILEFK